MPQAVSWLGDAVEEFKSFPTAGKIFVGVIVLGVAGLAVWRYSQQQASGTTSATQSSQGSLLGPASETGVSSGSDFPQISSGNTSVPLLPSGVAPLYNSQGNLVAFQPAASSTASTSGQTASSSTASSSSSSTSSAASKSSSSSSSSKPSTSSSSSKPSTSSSSNRTASSQAKSAPKPATKTTAKPAPSTPKITTYTVVSGDSLSAIAAKMHISGGWQALYNANKSVVGGNPNLIYPGQKLTIPK